VKLQIPVQVGEIKPRKDRSWKIAFETRELSGDEVKILVDNMSGEGWLVFSPNELLDADVPKENADSGMGDKSPSSRLRAVMWVWWKQKGKQGTFNQFYENWMERKINEVKEHLDQE
jgi:hypothetical protein